MAPPPPPPGGQSYIPEPVVARLDPDTGRVLGAWGAGALAMPHMLSLDREGNVWVADVGRHQVGGLGEGGGAGELW